MEKLTKAFLGKSVAVIDVPKSDELFYKRLNKYFSENDISCSRDLQSGVPDCAFVLSDKQDIPAVIEWLAGDGIKRILFYSKADGGEAVISDCVKRGIDARIGCPLALFAPGPCRLHGALSGIQRNA
jgi:hypothetical protein